MRVTGDSQPLMVVAEVQPSAVGASPVDLAPAFWLPHVLREGIP
jgi:hypothetical protein